MATLTAQRRDAVVKCYLRTGHYEQSFVAWEGSFLERSSRGATDLRQALLGAVQERASLPGDLRAFARAKVEPMVRPTPRTSVVSAPRAVERARCQMGLPSDRPPETTFEEATRNLGDRGPGDPGTDGDGLSRRCRCLAAGGSFPEMGDAEKDPPASL